MYYKDNITPSSAAAASQNNTLVFQSLDGTSRMGYYT